DTEAAKFDLAFWVVERRTDDGLPAGLDISLEYRTDLFEHDTAKSVAHRFLTLLELLVTEPDRPLSTVTLLDPHERARMLNDWNDTAVDVPDTSVTELLVEQARTEPDELAEVAGKATLTYYQIIAQAERAAAWESQHGDGAERQVPVAVP